MILMLMHLAYRKTFAIVSLCVIYYNSLMYGPNVIILVWINIHMYTAKAFDIHTLHVHRFICILCV